jgi:hypothetical protein
VPPVGTFQAITFYSIIVMVIVTLVGGAFTLLGLWLSEQSEEEDAGH